MQAGGPRSQVCQQYPDTTPEGAARRQLLELDGCRLAFEGGAPCSLLFKALGGGLVAVVAFNAVAISGFFIGAP